MWLYVAGILKPDVLAPDIDSSVSVGYPFVEKYLGVDGLPAADPGPAESCLSSTSFLVAHVLGRWKRTRPPQRPPDPLQ
jgi:hypothetical protein